MSTPSPDQSTEPGSVLALQQHRLAQILWALVAAMGLSMVISLAAGSYRGAALQGLAVAALTCAHGLNRANHLRMATAVMLCTLVVVLSSLIAMGEGLYDEAVVAFPGLLVFASMFGSRRLFVSLLLMILTVLTIVFATQMGSVAGPDGRSLELGRLLNLASILVVTSFFVWMLAGDLRRAMERLEADKQRILESHARIEILAHRDTLTQLPNRTLARDRLGQVMALARRNNTMAAVLYLDLDNFKTVNDSLGHAAGDDLLRQVAGRLQLAVRDSDTVSRQGGDEFLLLLGDVSDEEAITAAANKVMQQLVPPFTLNGMEVHVTASLGLAVFPRDGIDTDTLLKNADLAMYRAKEAGRNVFRFFDAAMNESVVEHLHMASGLRAALGNGELRVHYQPQFELASGSLVGAEALVRWKHPTLGFIPPAKFIPVAERTGLINDLGGWVLEAACKQMQIWRERGLGDLVVAVNVSPIQFRRDDIEREVANALAACGLPPSAVELELTESLLVADAQHVSEVLQRLGSQGIKFAIDDFGTGYSNLAYLQRFPVHRLKIDQSFVRKLANSPNEAGIVRAVIEMAHCLKLEVLAEGIEDAMTLQHLIDYGCEFGQGYHWSPALPALEFESLVRARMNPAL